MVKVSLRIGSKFEAQSSSTCFATVSRNLDPGQYGGLVAYGVERKGWSVLKPPERLGWLVPATTIWAQ